MYIDDGQFSEREKEVIGLLLQGKSNKQIALSLGISASTVEYHLKNVYKKLQVNSRTEAVLRLGKSIGNDTSGELRESTVEINGKPADNSDKFISTRRIPMNKMFYIIEGVLLTTIVLVAIIGFANANIPVQNADVVPMTQASVIPTIATPTITSSSILLPTEQILTNWQEATYTNTLNSSDITITLKWFYIDSTRVSMDFSVSGFVIPDGYVPLYQIVNNVSLHTSNGDLITPDYDSIEWGAVRSNSESNTTGAKNIFDQTVFFPIKNRELAISQEDSYIFDITVGGVPIYDNEGNATNEMLPSTTFHFEAKPSFVGSLTFVTEKAANIGDKVVTLKGVEINPVFSIIMLCVFSPDNQQWIPNASLLYKGNVFNLSGARVTNEKNALSKELCYRLEYDFQFDIMDNPKQSIAIWVNKLTKDQPERLPNELISSTFQKLSAKGIEFNYVIGEHGSSIEITKKPIELTENEVSTMIQNALTENALTSGILIFDLK
ncbi:MAG TPA: helix-turn-helix transcriptional regulator [Anaerolineales bacterium]|nr:helix-turn-helix transcriptional regulator [Anaerolineales bacterium]